VLSAVGLSRVYMFRPTYIYPVERRKEPSFTYRLLRWVYPIFRLLFPNLVVRADDLARVMVDVALRGSVGPVFENREIRHLAGVTPSHA
jgi:hypothetical protein